MNYEVFVAGCERSKRCSVAEAEKILQSIDSDMEFGDEEFVDKITRIAQLIASSETCIGSSDEFHNLAVSFVRQNCEDLACDVVNRGLETFPRSPDLLADFLKYGVSCGRFSECREKYTTLRGIPQKRWNWRAFSFAVDFLLDCLGCCDLSEESRIESEVRDVADSFCRLLPNSEDCYLAASAVEERFGNKQECLEILEKTLPMPFPAPKCSLKAADLYFEVGEYEKCEAALRKCERDALEPQLGVNLGYMALLCILCRLALASRTTHEAESNDELVLTESDERYLREHYAIASRHLDRSSTAFGTLQSVKAIIEIRSGLSLSSY